MELTKERLEAVKRYLRENRYQKAGDEDWIRRFWQSISEHRQKQMLGLKPERSSARPHGVGQIRRRLAKRFRRHLRTWGMRLGWTLLNSTRLKATGG